MRQYLQLASLSVVILVLAALPAAQARPWPGSWRHSDAYVRPRRYVAVPIEDVELIREVRQVQPQSAQRPPPHGPRHHSNHRYPQVPVVPVVNAAPAPQRPPQHHYEEEPLPYGDEQVAFAPEPQESRNRFERQSGGGGEEHEYVDYGAHTGHHGAFGWYADFPVISKGHR